MDRQPLGGQKPDYAHNGAPLNAADEEGSFKPKIAPEPKAKQEGGDEEKEVYSSGDTYNDQVLFF